MVKYNIPLHILPDGIFRAAGGGCIEGAAARDSEMGGRGAGEEWVSA